MGKELLKKLRNEVHEWIRVKEHTGDVKEIFAEFEGHWCTARFRDPDNPRKVHGRKLWDWLTNDTTTMKEIIQIIGFFGRNDLSFYSFIDERVYEESEVIDEMTPIYLQWLFVNEVFQRANLPHG